jgi:hypothetical protein
MTKASYIPACFGGDHDPEEKAILYTKTPQYKILSTYAQAFISTLHYTHIMRSGSNHLCIYEDTFLYIGVFWSTK